MYIFCINIYLHTFPPKIYVLLFLWDYFLSIFLCLYKLFENIYLLFFDLQFSFLGGWFSKLIYLSIDLFIYLYFYWISGVILVDKTLYVSGIQFYTHHPHTVWSPLKISFHRHLFPLYLLLPPTTPFSLVKAHQFNFKLPTCWTFWLR